MKRIFLCLDGTWNSTYAKDKREDGRRVIKPSNVLKIARALKSIDEKGVHQMVYYNTGVGSMSKHQGISNWFLRMADRFIGGIWGAGFEANIEDAFTYLINNYDQGDEIYVFGFSRGAATARAVTQFLDWMGGLPAKSDAYFMPILFRKFIKHQGTEPIVNLLPAIKKIENKSQHKITTEHYFPGWRSLEVKFLGVWDTVLSLGGRFIPVQNRRYFLKKSPAKCVANARQALAIDEKRADFKPSIWVRPNDEAIATQTLKQMWFAGVHSNVGGGYANDGLANISFHWMTDELLEVNDQIAFHEKPFQKFRKHIQNQLIDSKTWFYKFKDWITRRDGNREIRTYLDHRYQQSNLTIHHTALQRLKSDPNLQKGNGLLKHPLLEIYRPENLINYVNETGLTEVLETSNKGQLSNTEVTKITNFFKTINSSQIFHTKTKKCITGTKLKLNGSYKIRLTEVEPIYDLYTKSNFAGWLSTGGFIKSGFHRLIRKISRFPEANIFSLIGEIKGQQIDLGKIWKKEGKLEFEINLKDYFKGKSGEANLYLYFNDIHGFYWNNKGSFHIRVTPVKSNNTVANKNQSNKKSTKK
ncbi:MAG: DUF2235 domain-containing protein [Marinicella sp.]